MQAKKQILIISAIVFTLLIMALLLVMSVTTKEAYSANCSHIGQTWWDKGNFNQHLKRCTSCEEVLEWHYLTDLNGDGYCDVAGCGFANPLTVKKCPPHNNLDSWKDNGGYHTQKCLDCGNEVYSHLAEDKDNNNSCDYCGLFINNNSSVCSTCNGTGKCPGNIVTIQAHGFPGNMEVCPKCGEKQYYDRVYQCTICGIKGYNYGCYACGRSYSTDNHKDAPCPTCNGTGEVISNIPIIIVSECEHKLIVVIGNEPTCTEVGHSTCYKCEKCGKYFMADGTEIKYEDTEIPAVGHKFKFIIGNAATCTEVGHEGCFKCETCGKYFRDVAGKKQEIKYEDTEIPAAGHKFKFIIGNAATCTEIGHEGCFKCETCGKYFRDVAGKKQEIKYEDTEIPATGHKWSNWELDGNGNHFRHCIECNETQSHSKNSLNSSGECTEQGCTYKCQHTNIKTVYGQKEHWEECLDCGIKLNIQANQYVKNEEKENVNTQNETKQEENVNTKNETKQEENINTKNETKQEENINTKNETKQEENINTKNETKQEENINTKNETKQEENVNTKNETKKEENINTKNETKQEENVNTKNETKKEENINTKNETKQTQNTNKTTTETKQNDNAIKIAKSEDNTQATKSIPKTGITNIVDAIMAMLGVLGIIFAVKIKIN